MGEGGGGPQSTKDPEEINCSFTCWTKGTEVCAIYEGRSLGQGTG